MRSGVPQQGKRAQAHVLPVCVSSLQPCAPLGTPIPSCQSCLGGAHPQIIFPSSLCFQPRQAHKKGCELILASCPAHWDNDGFGVNVTPGCGQTWDLPAGVDAELQGAALWRHQARSKPA